MSADSIQLEGVRVHNLRNVSVSIRRNVLTVICGVSGSGKSSLAFDTLFAEGQRRYVETFSPYARQFLDRVERPDADRIDGIPPAIALRQNSRGHSSRSTVGTRTEVLDYLRVVFAKAGGLFCPDCDQTVERMTPDTAADYLISVGTGQRAMLVFVPDGDASVDSLLSQGFTRVIADDQFCSIEKVADEQLTNARVVADRLRTDEASRSRISESVEQLFVAGVNQFEALIAADETAEKTRMVDGHRWKIFPMSQRLMCRGCGRDFDEPLPESLNFQSPLGACSACEGHGRVSGMTLTKVVPDSSLSLRDGAIQPWTTPAYRHELDELLDLSSDYNIPCDVPFAELTDTHQRLIQEGVPERDFGGLNGFHRWLVRNRYKQGVAVLLNRWRSWLPCGKCNGTRLNQSAAGLRLNELTFFQAVSLELAELQAWLDVVRNELDKKLAATLSTVMQQLTKRVGFLVDSGLGYLSLNRSMNTLSGGEAQRVALTATLGSGTVNTLYVLDEPTAGLHPSDTQKIITAARRLQQSGNTVVVVEHDADFIRAADDVIEIGPAAGQDGGKIVFQGSPADLSSEHSATGRTLRAAEEFDKRRPTEHRTTQQWLGFFGVNSHNISNLNGRLPLGVIAVITGVSGSGKSSLMVNALYPALCRSLGIAAEPDEHCTVAELRGVEQLQHVELLDQQPLPRTRRSIPATLIGGFDDIRKLFAETHEAKKRNFKPGMFSFNSAKGGRCENCEGRGIVTVEMQFLADIQTTCEACSGQRFRSDVLDVRYRNRSIADVLNMTAETAFTFFNGHRRIQQRLNALRQAGLGYIRLGQPAATLSGGESQRLRIAALLAGVKLDDSIPRSSNRKPSGAGSTLFILDEPSTGLHMQDIEGLMKCLQHLVEIGHSVVVIEHDPEVVRYADYVIEMGPGAGRNGGQIVSAT